MIYNNPKKIIEVDVRILKRFLSNYSIFMKNHISIGNHALLLITPKAIGFAGVTITKK